MDFLTLLTKEHGYGKKAMRLHNISTGVLGNLIINGAGGNCAMKIWYESNPDAAGKWYDQECNSDYGKGLGPIHALCQVDK